MALADSGWLNMLGGVIFTTQPPPNRSRWTTEASDPKNFTYTNTAPLNMPPMKTSAFTDGKHMRRVSKTSFQRHANPSPFFHRYLNACRTPPPSTPRA